MFYVYGVTMNDCKKRARKKLIDSGEPMTQSEFDRKLIDMPVKYSNQQNLSVLAVI